MSDYTISGIGIEVDVDVFDITFTECNLSDRCFVELWINAKLSECVGHVIGDTNSASRLAIIVSGQTLSDINKNAIIAKDCLVKLGVMQEEDDFQMLECYCYS